MSDMKAASAEEIYGNKIVMLFAVATGNEFGTNDEIHPPNVADIKEALNPHVTQISDCKIHDPGYMYRT